MPFPSPLLSPSHRLLLRMALPLVCVVAFGCKRPPVDVVNTAGPGSTTTATAGTDAGSEMEEAVETIEANFRRVHFDVDSHGLDDTARVALDANAELLRRFPAVRVEVQGHADRRGTVDYNLALGLRRARAVVDHLRHQGVGPTQLSMVSMGEERPLQAGDSETVWSQNRRAEFRVTTPGQPVVGTTELAARR
mgnify:CR=1 FL=1